MALRGSVGFAVVLSAILLALACFSTDNAACRQAHALTLRHERLSSSSLRRQVDLDASASPVADSDSESQDGSVDMGSPSDDGEAGSESSAGAERSSGSESDGDGDGDGDDAAQATDAADGSASDPESGSSSEEQSSGSSGSGSSESQSQSSPSSSSAQRAARAKPRRRTEPPVVLVTQNKNHYTGLRTKDPPPPPEAGDCAQITPEEEEKFAAEDAEDGNRVKLQLVQRADLLSQIGDAEVALKAREGDLSVAKSKKPVDEAEVRHFTSRVSTAKLELAKTRLKYSDFLAGIATKQREFDASRKLRIEEVEKLLKETWASLKAKRLETSYEAKFQAGSLACEIMKLERELKHAQEKKAEADNRRREEEVAAKIKEEQKKRALASKLRVLYKAWVLELHEVYNALPAKEQELLTAEESFRTKYKAGQLKEKVLLAQEVAKVKEIKDARDKLVARQKDLEKKVGAKGIAYAKGKSSELEGELTIDAETQKAMTELTEKAVENALAQIADNAGRKSKKPDDQTNTKAQATAQKKKQSSTGSGLSKAPGIKGLLKPTKKEAEAAAVEQELEDLQAEQDARKRTLQSASKPAAQQQQQQAKK